MEKKKSRKEKESALDPKDLEKFLVENFVTSQQEYD